MVILPARNEGPRVASVVRGIRTVLPNVEVVVVVNDSGDDTAARAREAGATVLYSGSGYARALRIGFLHAIERGAEWVVTMDADGQHPPRAIPMLVAALKDADLVVGSRFVGAAGYAVPAARRLAIGALGAWASVCAGQRLRDVTSGLRAMRPDVIRAFAADYPVDVADANVLVRVVRAGWRVREVSVPMRERPGGRSMHDTPRSALFALRMAVYTAAEATTGGRA